VDTAAVLALVVLEGGIPVLRARAVLIALLVSFVAVPAQAMNFISLQYDEETDELKFVIAYRGTHANHQFSIDWEACRPLGDEGQQIFGRVIDSDPRDLARQDFRKEVVIDLSSFACRPARLSLGTFYNHIRTIDIPAKNLLEERRRRR
jgi:hypothetical protein